MRVHARGFLLFLLAVLMVRAGDKTNGPEMTSAHPRATPIEALCRSDQPGVLAVITGIDGPSYRPLGAMMAIFADGARVGTLSSGCIESDLVLHAQKALAEGKVQHVVYGTGSPFIDIQLPCGGGLEILVLPNPDKTCLQRAANAVASRQPATLTLNTETGHMDVQPKGATGRDGAQFQVRLLPELRFFIFGKGPESSTFAGLVQSAGYPNLLFSPDAETLDIAAAAGCEGRHLVSATWPPDVTPDPWSAIVLFFHDHEWEPPILSGALQSRAFYIGAQGSRRARENRDAELSRQGISPLLIERLRGPIGLVGSARDARTLAVGVLAEILDVAVAAQLI